nr:helix-turn-helix domain-containing protein [Halomicroarcula marina]
MTHGTTIELENLVPLGERAVPFFIVYDQDQRTFESTIRDHSSVDSLTQVSRHGEQALYALDWEVSNDAFFQGIFETQANLLSATGTNEGWVFEIRFPDHHRLAEFQEYCVDADIPIELGQVYNPTKPGIGPWYGLTESQRKTLIQAVGDGYYSIPRRISTQDLADIFGISDQAVTERLRRAIVALVENTLITAAADEDLAPVE